MSTKHERKYGGLTVNQVRRTLWGPATEVINDLLTELDAFSGEEPLQRLRRIETKVHKIAVHVGAEAPDGPSIVQAEKYEGRVVARVAGYDFTLAHLKRVLESGGMDIRERIYVVRGQDLLATIQLTNRAQ